MKNQPVEKKISVTMKDVAQLADVSPAIVSRFVNKDPTLVIKEETRLRVQEAIERLDYRPHYLARSLRTKSSGVIGLVVVDISNPFIAELVRGVQEVASSSGRFCFLSESRDDSVKEKELVRQMAERQVDGIILATLKEGDGVTEEIEKFGIKYVSATRTIPGLKAPSIVFNSVQSTIAAMEHLFGLNHKKIGYLLGHGQSFSGKMRIQVYQTWLEQHNIPFRPEYVEWTEYFAENGYKAMEKLLRLPEPPTAVITCNDVVALGAIKAARKQGLRIPEDLSIVGYNNIDVSSLVYPALTTIDTPAFEMGCQAARMVIDMIEERPIESPHVVLNTSLIIRDSTGPCREE